MSCQRERSGKKEPRLEGQGTLLLFFWQNDPTLWAQAVRSEPGFLGAVGGSWGSLTCSAVLTRQAPENPSSFGPECAGMGGLKPACKRDKGVLYTFFSPRH